MTATSPIIQKSTRLLVTGDHHVVKQFPMWGAGEALYLWAEKGLVCWEKAKTNTFGTMTWKDAANRVLALSEMIANTQDDARWHNERITMQRFVCAMETVIRDARRHGGPDDKGAGAYHKHNRVRPVVVPREFDNVVSGNFEL